MPGTEAARCSFCRIHPGDLRRLVRGPETSICDDCVELCAQILRDRDPVVSIQTRVARAACDPRRPPWTSLREELSLQPDAALTLARMTQDLLEGPRGARSALLLGPSGTGKSRALSCLADALRPLAVTRLEPGAGPVRERFAAPHEKGSVLVVDALERFAGEPRVFEEIAGILDRLAAASAATAPAASSPFLAVFAAVTTASGEGDIPDPLEARVDGRTHAVARDASPLLPFAASRGVPPALLARFEVFAPFEPLGETALRTLLAAREEHLLGCAIQRSYRLEIGPEATEVIVARALRLGGGVWGLKAVLTAMVSGLLPAIEEGAAETAPRRAAGD